MTAISDFCITVRDWLRLGDEEWPDNRVTVWVRYGEERLNVDLRIAAMMITSDATANVAGQISLPDDYIEMDFIRVINGRPLHYKNRDDFYTPDENGVYANAGKYTRFGYSIVIGDASPDNPLSVEMSYYGDVPVTDVEPTWLTTRYNNLLLMATLVAAGTQGIEDERMAGWGDALASRIDALNMAHKIEKVSGSRISTKSKRTFG